MRAVYNTPHEAFCITLFLTNCVVNCQILTLSKPKRTVTPYMYICLPKPLPIGASGMGIDVTKITLLSWKPLGLAGKV